MNFPLGNKQSIKKATIESRGGLTPLFVILARTQIHERTHNTHACTHTHAHIHPIGRLHFQKTTAVFRKLGNFQRLALALCLFFYT